MNRKGKLLCTAIMAAQLVFHAGALAQPLMENPDIPILDVKNQEPAYSVE